jgi:Arc/MetJ family transcription regulator
MVKRLTVELDEQLLERAKRTLGRPTTRATIEEALRRAVEDADGEFEERRQRQLKYLRTLQDGLDPDVLKSDEMWR